jgi:Flp pilus assembly protein TadG
MSRRKKTSGGQAIVMVTLALVAMCGMMGLAVDLGWSFFVQKQAQAAGDGAALAAVQEAVIRLGGGGAPVSGFTCASGGTGATKVDCETAAITCAAVASTSNLHNGCLYAKTNSFDPGANTRQKVTVQSSDGADANRPVGVNRISYWVRVKTVQTIPQLFSSVLGNTQGIISAVSTAGIVGSISPGSFYGMNHHGDCWSLPGAAGVNCGMDLDAQSTGKGKTACPGSGGGVGQVCAPAGIILSSDCNSSSPGGNTCSQGWAGNASKGNGVETGSLLVMGTGPPPNGGATLGNWHDATGNPVAPTYSTNASSFKDITSPNPQPPLQASSPIPSCGLLGGVLAGTAGPYQYYSYSTTLGGKPKPDGGAIKIAGTATFSSSGGCPGGVLSGGTAQSGSFPTFIFWGGLNVGGTMKLTAGQYLLAGVNSNAADARVFNSFGGTIQAADSTATGTGTLFGFTDGNYPGLGGPKVQGNSSGSGQISAVPNWDQMPALYQGNIYVKNANITMNGLVDSAVAGSNLPSTMDAYDGVVWWQDRRNSMVEYNQNPALAPNCALCTKDDGTVVGCADTTPLVGCTSAQTTGEIVTDNHVTSTSPGVQLDPGNGSINITGVYYQPRGAWIHLQNGTGFGTGKLQTITGSMQLTVGDDRFLLQGPTNPIIVFRAALIQ